MKGEQTAAELRNQTDAELLEKKKELERNMFIARSVLVTSGEKKQDAKIRSMRKSVARILTIIRERELDQSLREPLL